MYAPQIYKKQATTQRNKINFFGGFFCTTHEKIHSLKIGY